MTRGAAAPAYVRDRSWAAHSSANARTLGTSSATMGISSSVDRASESSMSARTPSSKPRSTEAASSRSRVVAVAGGEGVDVGEVACFSAIEQRDHLAARELVRVEGRAGDARGRWSFRCGVDGQVDDDRVGGAGDDEPDELRAVPDAAHGPTALGRGLLKGGSGIGDDAAPR